MKKDIYVVSNMYPGHANPTYGIFVKEQVDSLVEMGFNVKLNVISTRENFRALKLFRYMNLFMKAVLETLLGKSDVIHVHFVYPTGIFIPLVKKISSKRIVVTVHGSDVLGNSAFKTNCLKSIFKNSDEVIVAGSGLKDIVTDKFGASTTRVHIIPCGYRSDLFYPLATMREDDNLNILFLSRLYKEKGTDILKDIISKVASDNNIKFWIVGDGPEKERLQQLLSKNENVTFYGMVSKIEAAKWFQKADMFLFPSQREGFGLVALESLACGTPVIASNISGITDIVRDKYNGCLAEVDNADSFVEAIRFLSECEEFEKIRENARETARSYTLRKQIEKIIELYK